MPQNHQQNKSSSQDENLSESRSGDESEYGLEDHSPSSQKSAPSELDNLKVGLMSFIGATEIKQNTDETSPIIRKASYASSTNVLVPLEDLNTRKSQPTGQLPSEKAIKVTNIKRMKNWKSCQNKRRLTMPNLSIKCSSNLGNTSDGSTTHIQLSATSITLCDQEAQNGFSFRSEFYQHYDYNSKQLVGSGQFSSAYKCVQKETKKEFIVKITRSDEEQTLLEAKNEFEILQMLDCEHIMKAHRIYEEPLRNSIYTVVDKAGSQTLKNLVKSVDYLPNEAQIKRLMVQLLKGLAHCHEKKITHRDIKPDNLMISKKEDDSDHLVIIDFNVAAKKLNSLTQATGKEKWSAPETRLNRFGGYDHKIDSWSAGCVLYYLVAETSPFKTKQQIQTGSFVIQQSKWKILDSQAQDLLKRLLETSPILRITVAEALNHPWLQEDEILPTSMRMLPRRKGSSSSKCLSKKILGEDKQFEDQKARVSKTSTCLDFRHKFNPYANDILFRLPQRSFLSFENEECQVEQISAPTVKHELTSIIKDKGIFCQKERKNSQEHSQDDQQLQQRLFVKQKLQNDQLLRPTQRSQLKLDSFELSDICEVNEFDPESIY